MADITMPQLGETVTEGTITKWFKAVGDTVAEDEPLFEVSTDKVDSEVPSPVSGTLTEIKVAEGDTVDVGVVLAVGHLDLGEGAAHRRRHLGVDLVRRHLEEHLVLRDRLADLLEPLRDRAFGDGLTELRHDDVGHGSGPWSVVPF